MGGKPSTSTPADRRLKANKPTTPGSANLPKFGSPEWQARYGNKKTK